MKLKNYTSSMSPLRSAQQIKDILIALGAKRIAEDYDAGNLQGITFQLEQNGLPMVFKLTVNVEQVRNSLKELPRLKFAIDKQAANTAWKLLLDEIEIKASRIMIEKMNPLKAFLSDVYNVQEDKTFYEILEQSKFKLLLSGK